MEIGDEMDFESPQTPPIVKQHEIRIPMCDLSDSAHIEIELKKKI